jgi:hypothetical protein
MHPSRFDALSRTLGRQHSRRTTLAVLLAGPLALLGGSETAARHKKHNPCKGKADNIPCKGSGRCLSGVCHLEPTCLGFAGICSDDSQCCNRTCDDQGSGDFVCQSNQPAGTPCHADRDCDFGLHCVGYVCMSTSCPLGSDACAENTPSCGAGGLCLRPLGGGDTRCGISTQTTCGCTSQQHCLDTFGAGAFCVTFSDGLCTCGNRKQTFCAFSA